MNEVFGFSTEEYECGSTIETLMTGDGKTQFIDVKYDDGRAGIAIGYGDGKGVGVKEVMADGTLTTDMDVKWQIKFQSQASIDSMIETLLRVKNSLQD